VAEIPRRDPESTGYADFLARDRKLWIGTAASDCPGRATGGVAQYVPPHPVAAALPLATNFDLGRGKGFSVGGFPVSTAPWSNLGLQGLLPTHRFCFSGACHADAVRGSIRPSCHSFQ
jgi:endo-beta-N-acetylglucosaminidase D